MIKLLDFVLGTHASAAYVANLTKTKSVLVKDYVVAQHFDVWSQLVFGIRYLDFSIGYAASSNRCVILCIHIMLFPALIKFQMSTIQIMLITSALSMRTSLSAH